MCFMLLYLIYIYSLCIKFAYSYFCFDFTIWGFITNLFTIYNPVCYWLNWANWTLKLLSLFHFPYYLLVSKIYSILEIKTKKFILYILHMSDKELKDKNVKTTFYITYVFLLTTATVTFIESMRTKFPKIRNILNLETCISVVAAYFYSLFVEKIKNKEIDYKEINVTRYTDWAITTLSSCLITTFLYNTGGNLKFTTFLFALLLIIWC